MKFRPSRFNTYLWLLVLTWGVWGCHTAPKEKQAPKKGYSAVSFHIEVTRDGTDKNSTVTIGRQVSFPLNVTKNPFLETSHLTGVSLMDDGMGGFGLKFLFDRQGSWLLEQYTVANKGRRIAVLAELDDFQWIAAPLITQKISDGVFTLTPDASREEAEKLVLGLKKSIKKIRSRNTLNEPETK